MIVAIILLAGVALLAWVNQPLRYKYRLTVDVSTPAGPRSGSAVQQVVLRPTLPLLAASEYTTRQEGDAVAVDLPDGSVLFVLLSQEMVRAALAEGRYTDMKAALEQAEPGKDYEYSRPPTKDDRRTPPRFVKFRDLADPASVYEVDPSDLGGGAAIRRIAVQLTRDPLTRTIQQRLPWLPDYYDKSFDGVRSIVAPTADQGLAARMSSGQFRSR